jgi:hypothetical protein
MPETKKVSEPDPEVLRKELESLLQLKTNENDALRRENQILRATIKALSQLL